jgi:hypothetical protein
MTGVCRRTSWFREIAVHIMALSEPANPSVLARIGPIPRVGCARQISPPSEALCTCLRAYGSGAAGGVTGGQRCRLNPCVASMTPGPPDTSSISPARTSSSRTLRQWLSGPHLRMFHVKPRSRETPETCIAASSARCARRRSSASCESPFCRLSFGVPKLPVEHRRARLRSRSGRVHLLASLWDSQLCLPPRSTSPPGITSTSLHLVSAKMFHVKQRPCSPSGVSPLSGKSVPPWCTHPAQPRLCTPNPIDIGCTGLR